MKWFLQRDDKEMLAAVTFLFRRPDRSEMEDKKGEKDRVIK